MSGLAAHPTVRRWAPPALLLLLAAALIWPALPGGGKVMAADDLLLFSPPFDSVRPPDLLREANGLHGDSVYVFHPDQLFSRQLIRAGELPVWNNLSGAGQPLLAQQQTAPLYPGTLLTFLLPYWESLGLVAALKLFIAALGTYLFGRALGLGRMASVLAGACFAFGTYMVVWLEHPHSNAYILLPWLMLLTDRVIRRGRPGYALALGAVGGLALLAGHPQSVIIEMLPVGAFALWRLAGRRRPEEPPPALGRVLGLLGGALALSLLVGAVMLLPFVELVSQSYYTNRPNPTLEWRTVYSIFFPEFWGRPDKFQLLGGPINYAERTFYIGALPTALAVAGLVARRPGRDQLFLAAVGVVTLLAALDTPIWADLVRDVPGLRSIALLRVLIVVSFCGALLAGYGLQRLLDGDAAGRRRMLIAIAAVVVLAALPWIVQQGVPFGDLRAALGELPEIGLEPRTPEVTEFAAVLRWFLLGAIGLGLVLGMMRLPRAAPALVGVLLAVSVVELVALNRGYNPAIEKSLVEPEVPDSVRFVQDAGDVTRIAADTGGFGPNTASRYGLSDARTHGLPVLERYSRLWGAAGGAGFQRTLLDPTAAAAPLALDVFGVSHVFSPGLAAEGAEVLFAGQGWPVVRNAGALPRAFVAYRWQLAGDIPITLAAIRAYGAQRIRDMPLVEGLATKGTPGGPAPAATAAEVVEESPTEISMRVRAREPGLLVLSDNHYPGWKAYVDGEPREIRAANVAFRSVQVPAGDHRVRFAYQSSSVRWGVVLSGLGLVLLAGSALALPLARRRGG